MKILLVDESAEDRARVRKKLKDAEPDAVLLETDSFAEARVIANEERPDIMVIEIVAGRGFRPGMQLVSGMRETHPQMPIIIYSRETMTGIAEAAVKLGAMAFVPKSSGVPNELTDTVRAYALPH